MKTYNFDSIKRILFFLERVKNLMNSDKYKLINTSNNTQKFNLPQRYNRAITRLQKYSGDQVVLFEENLNIKDFVQKWEDFDHKFDGSDSVENKVNYGALLKYTSRILEYLREVPIQKAHVSQEEQNIISPENVSQRKLDDINARRTKLKEALEKAKAETPVDPDKVKQIQSKLEEASKDFMIARDQLENSKMDTKAKESLTADIDKAFKDLSTYTSKIDDEQKRLNIEYWASLIAIGVLILCLLFAYTYFILNIISKSIVLSKPIDCVPYTLGLGIFIGLIAVCLYLKGRANKISIELSTRLFNIHYLEGLMNMTNKLSKDHSEAVVRINDIIGSLENSYIRQVDENVISEKLVSKWEKKEITSSPYFKLLIEIKEILTKLEKK